MTPFSQSLDCPGAVPETFMVNATNDDGSAGCVHTDMIAEPTSQGRLRISFTENVNILIVNEVYDARVHAVNSAGNTPSNGFVRFSKYNIIVTVACNMASGTSRTLSMTLEAVLNLSIVISSGDVLICGVSL